MSSRYNTQRHILEQLYFEAKYKNLQSSISCLGNMESMLDHRSLLYNVINMTVHFCFNLSFCLVFCSGIFFIISTHWNRFFLSFFFTLLNWEKIIVNLICCLSVVLCVEHWKMTFKGIWLFNLSFTCTRPKISQIYFIFRH